MNIRQVSLLRHEYWTSVLAVCHYSWHALWCKSSHLDSVQETQGSPPQVSRHKEAN